MKQFLYVVLALVIVLFALPVGAQEDITPEVEVHDQLVTDKVYVDDVHAQVAGWIVIHIDNGGSPGPVAGLAQVQPGHNDGVWVDVDTSVITPVLFAMLHVDDGEVGVYEFDGASGLDNPVSVDGQIVTPSFNVAAIDMDAQVPANNVVTAKAVTTPQAGFLVIHSEQDGGPGPVLGFAQIPAGTSTNVQVTLTGNVTSSLWPMLHVDDGTVGAYEFDGASGLDNPVFVNNQVATVRVATVPSIAASPQVLLPADGQEAATGPIVFRADSAFSSGPGFVVIHADNGGQPGPVLGYTSIAGGSAEDLLIPLSGDITPVVWPMLHVDDGQAGVYEFDGASGLDNPVVVNGNVVTFPVAIAPGMTVSDQTLGTSDAGATVTVASALINVPGWMVIHSSVNGTPGPVIGQTAVTPGFNRNIAVVVDPAAAGSQVFPMLHYDTGEVGVYEFDGQNGLDLPVSVGGNVVVAPVSLGGQAAAPATTVSCSVSPAGGSAVNIRSAANTNSSVQASLAAGSSADADGQVAVGGYTWFRLTSGGFVRGDVVSQTGDCASLPTVDGGASGGAANTGGGGGGAPQPASTPEVNS